MARSQAFQRCGAYESVAEPLDAIVTDTYPPLSSIQDATKAEAV
jgi:hypothetical protein